MVAIAEPFKTDIDVTGETLIEELPEGYAQGMKQRLLCKAEELKALQQGLEGLSRNPDVEELLMDQAHQTVSKFDDHIIQAVFHVGLSTYLKPLNLGLKCESGSGKSYGTRETITFLPPEDVQFIGSQSPKVISHENGVRKTKDGRNFEEIPKPQKPDRSDEPDASVFSQLMENWKEDVKAYRKLQDECYYEVDLRNKIIIFLESINVETFKMFKATMSGDNPWIDHKYVDDKGKVHVTRLIGAPALIFNSLDTEYLEEFATRNLTATPSTRQEKIEDAMLISNKKSCYPWIYEKEAFNKRLIQEYVRKIKFYIEKGKIKAANPFDGLYQGFSQDAIRDMRDFNKFLELMPSYTLFKLFQRPIMTIEGARYLIPAIQDALDAKAAFDSIIETTKTGSDARIIEFYHKVVADKVNGSDAETLTDLYNKDRKHPKSVHRVRIWLQHLVEIGWVDVREGVHENDKGWIDRRFNNYLPLKKNASNAFISETDVLLKGIFEKSFNTWLENVYTETDFPPKIIILNIDGTATEITLEEMKAIILKAGGKSKNVYTFSKDKSTTEPENKPESTSFLEKTVIDAISTNPKKTLIAKRIKPTPGQLCTGEGKGEPCILEATWDITGNLYCNDHFQKSKKTCEDNGFAVELSKLEEAA